MDAGRAFQASVCVMDSGAVDGGEAQGSRRSVWRRRGALVSAVPGAAGLTAQEGAPHRTAGATAGGAGTGSEYVQQQLRLLGSFHVEIVHIY